MPIEHDQSFNTNHHIHFHYSIILILMTMGLNCGLKSINSNARFKYSRGKETGLFHLEKKIDAFGQ